MPDNYKISEMTTAAQIKDEDYVELSQADSNVSGGRISLKTTILAIANKIATAINFSGLSTTSKNLVGAINEAASAGGSDVEVTNTLTPSDTRQRIATVTVDEDDTDIYADDAEKVVKDMCSDKTYTGNPVTVESVNGGKAKSCEVSFSPIQDLHGQSAPYPAGGGKNRFQLTVSGLKSANTQGTWNGNIYTRNGVAFELLTDNGENITGIKVSGTASANADFYGGIDSLVNDTQYYLNGGVNGGSDSTYKLQLCYASNYSSIAAAYDTNDESFTYNSAKHIGPLTMRIRVYSGYAITSAIIFKPMIRLSTETDSSFAPYSNNCPISGRDSLSLSIGDNNILPFNNSDFTINNVRFKCENGELTVNGTATGNISSTDSSYKTNFAFDLPAGNYCFTRDSQANYTIYLRNLSDDSEVARNNQTFSLNSITRVYFGIYIANGTTVSGVTKNILNAGNTALPYSPYRGLTTHTATFTETVYGGKWLPQEGKAIIEWVAVDLGDFDYVYDSAYQLFTKSPSTITDILPPDINTDIVSAISENYKAISSNNMFLAENNNCFGVSTGKVFRIKDTRYTDATQFKTALSGVHLCYELATPTEITLTAEQIELLKGQNVLWSDANGNIAITAQALEFLPDTGTDIPLKTATAIVRPKPGETNGDHIQISTDGGTTFEEYYYNDMNGQSNAKNLPPFFRIWYASPYWYIQARTYTELDGEYYFPQETVMVQEYDSMYQFEISGIVFGN